MSDRAHNCRHHDWHACGCMPTGPDGWPLIWHVAMQWGVSSGAGNGFNHQVNLRQLFEQENELS